MSTERKPRQRRTFAEKIADIEERIAKHEAAAQALNLRKLKMMTEHKAKAEKMLAEADATPNVRRVPE